MLTTLANPYVRTRMLQCTLRRKKAACYQLAFVWVRKGCSDYTHNVVMPT